MNVTMKKILDIVVRREVGDTQHGFRLSEYSLKTVNSQEKLGR